MAQTTDIGLVVAGKVAIVGCFVLFLFYGVFSKILLVAAGGHDHASDLGVDAAVVAPAVGLDARNHALCLWVALLAERAHEIGREAAGRDDVDPQRVRFLARVRLHVVLDPELAATVARGCAICELLPWLVAGGHGGQVALPQKHVAPRSQQLIPSDRPRRWELHVDNVRNGVDDARTIGPQGCHPRHVQVAAAQHVVDHD